jgi:hypothetical protein
MKAEIPMTEWPYKMLTESAGANHSVSSGHITPDADITVET